MKLPHIFDVCLGAYRNCRELQAGRPGALNPYGSAQRLYRPDRSPRLAEYIRDFELCCLRGLGKRYGRSWKQFRFVETYYFAGMGYEETARHLGIAFGTLDRWNCELRKAIAVELDKAHVFPPKKYFQEPSPIALARQGLAAQHFS